MAGIGWLLMAASIVFAVVMIVLVIVGSGSPFALRQLPNLGILVSSLWVFLAGLFVLVFSWLTRAAFDVVDKYLQGP